MKSNGWDKLLGTKVHCDLVFKSDYEWEVVHESWW